MRRYASHQDAIAPDVVAALEACSCSVLKLESRSKAGVADLLVGVIGINVLMEVKSGEKAARRKSATATAQAEWAAAWRGRKPVTVKSVAEALAVVASLRALMTSSEVAS